MKKLLQSLNRYFTRLGQERVRQELLRMDDHLLADAGFSRELLLAGHKAWPWRAPREDELYHLQPQPEKTELSEAEIQLAVAELQSFSDRELNDLGLGRGDIEHAVRYGRPQDQLAPRKAA